jgi:hypothetical protein
MSMVAKPPVRKYSTTEQGGSVCDAFYGMVVTKQEVMKLLKANCEGKLAKQMTIRAMDDTSLSTAERSATATEVAGLRLALGEALAAPSTTAQGCTSGVATRDAVLRRPEAHAPLSLAARYDRSLLDRDAEVRPVVPGGSLSRSHICFFLYLPAVERWAVVREVST